MLMRVLGCSGSDLPGHHLTSFLVNEHVLLDAGSVTSSLSLEEQAKITDIFVTHSHLDHIKDILFLADNLIEFFTDHQPPPVNIRGLPQVLEAIAAHLLNDTIWPDFTAIPPHAPVLTYAPMPPGQAVSTGGLCLVNHPVNHAKHSAGYVIRGQGPDEGLAYSGDTGPTDDWWHYLANLPAKIPNYLTEASFPNAMEEMALRSKHLTPGLLRQDLEKLPYRPKVFIYHMKAPFTPRIQEELHSALDGYHYHFLREGEVLKF
jgi:cAMP phosphodiesterase